MDRRHELHEQLCQILTQTVNPPPANARRHVYFQPPESIRMEYPCIVYARSRIDVRFAADKPYSHKKEYTVTVIDGNPDSLIPDAVAKLPLCSHNRHFTADNLHHDVFKIYY